MYLRIISIIAFTPSYYFDFYSPFLYCLMVEGCWVLSVASKLPLTNAQSVLSNSCCHLSPLTESISLRLPPQVCYPAQTQPFGLLLQVKGSLSSGHHTGSTWNCTTACKGHERGDVSGASGFNFHSTLQGILADTHSVPPQNGLHILAPFPPCCSL